jgi:hypothetical protein
MTDKMTNKVCDNEEVIYKSEISPLFSLRTDSTIYVVSVDDVPQFYTTDMYKAHEYMWDISNWLMQLFTPSHNCWVRQTNDEKSLDIIGERNLYIISYERTLCRINIQPVCELAEILEPIEPNRTVQTSGFLSSIFGSLKID